MRQPTLCSARDTNWQWRTKVVRQNAPPFPSFSPLSLCLLLISLPLRPVTPRLQVLPLFLFLLFLLSHLVSLNMNSCLSYPQSGHGGLAITQTPLLTVILSFLHVVPHPSLGQTLSPLPPRPLRPFNNFLEFPYLYPTSLIPIQKLSNLLLLPPCHPILRGIFVLPINLMTVSVLSTCMMS